MKKVGITGSIGSGKTVVCRVFSLLGIPVYNADTAAKEIMNVDFGLRNEIKNTFGEDIFLPVNKGGMLDRKKLALIVFNNPKDLARLNSIVHPAVTRDFELWVGKNNTAPYVIKEAAILLESGAHKNVDAVILVTSPEALRKQRVMLRDHVSEKDFDARQANQWHEDEKREHADFIITNDEQELIIPQVMTLHQNFLSTVK